MALLDVLFEVLLACFLGFCSVVVVAEVGAGPVMNDSFDSFAYGLASGLPVKVPPPAEGTPAAGPLPKPDWPPPVPPLEPPVLPVCPPAMAQLASVAHKVKEAILVRVFGLMGFFEFTVGLLCKYSAGPNGLSVWRVPFNSYRADG